MDNTRIDPLRLAGPEPAPDVPRSNPELSFSADGSDLRNLGEFKILRRLGEGGTGAVYLAYDNRKGRQVALKVLNDQLAASQDYLARFYREAKNGAVLDHPNIIHTLDVGQDRVTGKFYLVLEYIDGFSAHALLDRQGPLAIGDAVHVALDVARALEHAHSRNIVHRDVKPDNILITHSGVAKLGDLGLAKRTDEASHLTAARQGFGTTPYMPYEQAINAKGADGRSDIYALGATLYHLVTGQVPFPGESHLEVVEKKRGGLFSPASALNGTIPAILDQILDRMLARDPRDRYQTASELIVDLERSRLSAPFPSFADPEQARKDPWIQQCLTSSEPTRLDPQSTVGREVLNGDDTEVWLLRYQGRDGRMRTSRTNTRQIRQRLEAGSLSSEDLARPHESGEFQPLVDWPAFADLFEEPEEATSRRESNWLVACGVVSMLALVVCGLVWWWIKS
jgi:serine/threonine-protein kinase